MDSEYLQYLPRTFKEGHGDESAFLGQYLKIFEALLTGRSDAAPIVGLEERISRFENYLDAALTPVEETTFAGTEETRLDSAFLTYLAKWVALVFDQNWPLNKKRQWLQKIVPLYKKRGTTSGLLEYLKMFVGKQVKVEEPVGGFIVGEQSTVAFDTYIGGTPIYYFRVKINYAFPGDEPFDYNLWKNLRKGVKTIVDLEKPAHTYYDVDIRTPGFVLGQSSTLGVDTLIWENSEKIKID
jgi:phage tail-like protein